MEKTLTKEKTFTELFEEIQDDVQKKLEAAENKLTLDATIIDAIVGIQGKGGVPVDFKIDENGNSHNEIKKTGCFGVTLHLDAYIKDPDDLYDVTVSSNAGGGGTWKNIKSNEHMTCPVKTKLVGETKVVVDIHAHVARSTIGHAYVDYTY